MKEQRLYAVVIALFGLSSIASAALSVYRAHSLRVLGAAGPLSAGQLELVQTASHNLVLAATLDAVLGIVALSAAYGIVRNRKWPLWLWLGVVTVGAVGSAIAIGQEPSHWFDHLTFPALCIISWLIFGQRAKELKHLRSNNTLEADRGA
jgi:hypothetical protein